MSKKSPRPLSELDLATRQRIEELTAKQPHELSPSDRAFMRGRADYLTEAQIEDYCGEEPVTEETDEEEESYMDWSLPELKEEVEARGLTIEGNKNAKAPYVEALEADDEANPDE